MRRKKRGRGGRQERKSARRRRENRRIAKTYSHVTGGQDHRSCDRRGFDGPKTRSKRSAPTAPRERRSERRRAAQSTSISPFTWTRWRRSSISERGSRSLPRISRSPWMMRSASRPDKLVSSGFAEIRTVPCTVCREPRPSTRRTLAIPSIIFAASWKAFFSGPSSAPPPGRGIDAQAALASPAPTQAFDVPSVTSAFSFRILSTALVTMASAELMTLFAVFTAPFTALWPCAAACDAACMGFPKPLSASLGPNYFALAEAVQSKKKKERKKKPKRRSRLSLHWDLIVRYLHCKEPSRIVSVVRIQLAREHSNHYCANRMRREQD